MTLEAHLSQSLSRAQAVAIAIKASADSAQFSRLWQLAASTDGKISINALWALTLLPAAEFHRTEALRDAMIDRLMSERVPTRKRLLLQLLSRQNYDATSIRTNFLDYCLAAINAESEPYAVRCYSMYAAFKMCRHYPELRAELSDRLELLRTQSLSPGLRSALRQTLANISKQPSRRNPRNHPRP